MPGTIPAAWRRRTETPNATMTTLASPTLGPTDGLSLWEVEMAAGAQGPRHVVDSEQIWTVLEGAVDVAVLDAPHRLRAGDTIALPAGAERQITAPCAARLIACGHAGATVTVPGEATPRGTPAWIA